MSSGVSPYTGGYERACGDVSCNKGVVVALQNASVSTNAQNEEKERRLDNRKKKRKYAV